MTDKNIQEAPVGSGTAIVDKSSEKRAQISLKMLQLRMKQNKERASLAAQKKSLQKEETMDESFSASQIAALKAEYSKINGIDPASDTYKKLIAMLDRLDLKSLQSLAGAEVKFVSALAKNRVMRKSMKKEEVEIKEGSGPKEKQTSKYVDRTSAESKAKVQAAKDRMVSDKKAEAGKALLSKLKKEDVQLDELSTNKLADYKKKAGADASAADKAGDMKRGNKRFSGIMKATRKQFGNDAKQKTEELSPKQKEIDKNKNGKIDGFDLAHLRKKNEELSPKQKELDKNKNGKIDGTDLAHLRSKKKLPQGADFAAQRRKERLASTGRMDEEVKVGDKVSFNHPMKAIPGKTMKKVGTVHKVEDDTVHVKVKDKYGVITHKKTASELTREEFNIGEESINEKSDYEIYHKDYSTAVQTAIKQAEKRGYEVDMDDWHDKVATGPKKPSSGKTNSFSVNLMKDGKPSKKKLQMQVYNMDNHKYELNMYIEEVEISEAGPGLWANIRAKRERIAAGSNERMRKPGEEGAPESGALDRAKGKNEAASPAQQAAIAIAMKKDGKKPKDMEEMTDDDKSSIALQAMVARKKLQQTAGKNKSQSFIDKMVSKANAGDRLPKKPADEYDRKVVKYLKKKHGMSEANVEETYESVVDKIKSIKRGLEARAKASDHFDKAGDPKNANASKDLKKAVRYSNLLNKEEVVLEARKKSFKDVKKKMKEEEVPNKSTVKKGDMLTGKREPIEINPELKEPGR